MKVEKRHFLQIINEHKGTVRSLCQVYYTNEEDRKDAFQDIILQLWKSFDSFLGKSDISTWIYRVSLNTIFTKKRGEKKSVATESLDAQHRQMPFTPADDNLELLSMVLRSLKDIDKAIVLLYLEGYRNREIAEILKLSPTNVATRFNRLKSELKLKFNSKSHATK